MAFKVGFQPVPRQTSMLGNDSGTPPSKQSMLSAAVQTPPFHYWCNALLVCCCMCMLLPTSCSWSYVLQQKPKQLSKHVCMDHLVHDFKTCHPPGKQTQQWQVNTCSAQHTILACMVDTFSKQKPRICCIVGPAESLVTAWDRLTQAQSCDSRNPVRQSTGQTQGQSYDSHTPVRQWTRQTQGQVGDSNNTVRQWAGQTKGQSDDSDTSVRQWTRQTQGQSPDSDTPVRQQTAQTLALPLLHRNRDRGTGLLRKLFGPAWHREVVPEARLQVN